MSKNLEIKRCCFTFLAQNAPGSTVSKNMRHIYLITKSFQNGYPSDSLSENLL